MNNPLKYYFLKIKEDCNLKINKDIATHLNLSINIVNNAMNGKSGSYIIVKADGEVLAYHIYNRNFFEQYLLDNTICERASTGMNI